MTYEVGPRGESKPVGSCEGDPLVPPVPGKPVGA